MKTREQILKLWNDTESCPDFSIVLNELLDDRDKLLEQVSSERIEAFHAGYKSREPIIPGDGYDSN